MFKGDTHQLKGGIAMGLRELLPPGQLLAAASPGAPEEEQQPPAAQRAQAELPTP